MNQPRNRQDLQKIIQSGKRPKYIFFWGHTPRTPEGIDKSCLSNWYNSTFRVEGFTYPTAEHYMMAEKARLFADHKIEEAILKANTPGEAKALGRKVRNFSEERWVEARFTIMVEGLTAKFSQHPAMATFLRNTGKRVIVEASPQDRIWGIGLSADHQDAERPQNWKGENLLGFALMETRDLLEHHPEVPPWKPSA